MFTLESLVENQRGSGIHVVNAASLMGPRWDPGLRRPYLGDDGRVYVDVTVNVEQAKDERGQLVYNSAGVPVMQRVLDRQLVTDRVRHGLPVLNVDNASVLRLDSWKQMDTVVGQAVRQRLRAWTDLRAASTMGGFDGMATPILEHEIITDVGQAIMDMEGIAEGRNFQPSYALQGLPLPITHSDFWMSERFLAASRAKGQPQDTVRGEQAGERVGELIEKVLIGIDEGVEFGDSANYMYDSKVYGYTNHPDRILKTDLTASSGLTGEAFVADVIEMREQMFAQGFFGPFILYVSTAYDGKLDADLKANSDRTIRQRAMDVDGLTAIRRLDYLTGDVMIMVQMTSNVVQAINGLEVVTVQWEAKGGMQKMFKVMGIQVPRIRSVYKSGTQTRVTGILHATTS